MNPQMNSNTGPSMMNRVVLGIFLLVIIAVSAGYLILKYPVYENLGLQHASAPIAERISPDEQDAALAQLDSSGKSSVKEVDRIDALNTLASASVIETDQRNTMLKSLR
jgi:hypothetical protein